ncbi:MAG: hypothetical protein HY791_13645 [Deltaproteobacteria bacterium]|nr:hypothetical protein [Deltaproteobacteria bacterium]
MRRVTSPTLDGLRDALEAYAVGPVSEEEGWGLASILTTLFDLVESGGVDPDALESLASCLEVARDFMKAHPRYRPVLGPLWTTSDVESLAEALSESGPDIARRARLLALLWRAVQAGKVEPRAEPNARAILERERSEGGAALEAELSRALDDG